MKKYFLAGLFMVAAVLGWGQDHVWDDFYTASSSMAEAEAVSLDSTDAEALRKAGVYFFSIAHGALEMQINIKKQRDNSLMAVEYLEAANKQDKSNTQIMTWFATASLAHAGVAKKISDKIKYSNKGIRLFDAIPSAERENLDFLFMRINSYTHVPKNFKDMTEIVQSDGAKYAALYRKIEDSLGESPHAFLKESVYVGVSNSYYVKKDKQEARDYLAMVEEKTLLSRNDEASSIVELYKLLKKKL